MVEILKQVPLFSSLQKDELETIIRFSTTRKYPKETMIFLEDEEGDTLFIILKGKVKVSNFSESGKEIILSILNAGDFFGEMSLLDGKPRSASVTAIEDSELRLVHRNDFLSVIKKHPQIAFKLLGELSSRLRKADQLIDSLANLNVTGRIAGILLQLAEERGIQTNQGVLIQSRPTHQELANMVGATRETVTRVLKQLEVKKYVTMSGKDLCIVNPDLFRRAQQL
ncbi:Crp/Fnr family transcriptional regulator [Candidatus Latescibacterota bacterium]